MRNDVMERIKHRWVYRSSELAWNLF